MHGELIPLGYIVSPHGIKGHVLLKTYSGEGTSLLRGIFLFIKKNDNEYLSLKIIDARPYKKFFLVKFEEVFDRSASERLVGCEVYIKRDDLPETEEDEYYWIDLIGCDVYSLEGEYLGKVDSLIDTGSVDVFVVKNEKKEYLYPFSKNVVKSVDIKFKKIIVDISMFRDVDL